ncbi:hypothetical protein G7Y89_g3999 [Cudoniella acicularis]|uniref:Uncharacterized protein n=1 Tax=Cudoniella acicularis TaxID=354080 RepID=A0A8H4RQA0_9HELO|nr:hypothetical protein G7Y89_g3999 [Cudoniella acicularis]
MKKYVRQEKSQRKHPVASSSTSLIKAPVIPAHIKERPDWKGPGFVKKAPKQPPRQTISPFANIQEQQQHLPIDAQQLLLNIFRTTFQICQDCEALKPILHEIKNGTAEKDFDERDSEVPWQEAYAVRWSPNRALCYATILVGLCEEFREELWMKKLLRVGGQENEIGIGEASKVEGTTADEGPLKVVCFGGGAAELMAFGAMLHHVRADAVGKPVTATVKPDATAESIGLGPAAISTHSPILDLHLVDATNWNPVISSLETGITTPPPLSKYASARAQVNNSSFLTPNALKTFFHQTNILETHQEELATILGTEAALITLCFTLKKLHTTSVAKTAAFLLKLTLATPKDSLLLVVDRPEESLEAKVEIDGEGKERKRYPMHYLLDMALMGKISNQGLDDRPEWEKLVGVQSGIFKMGEGLKYPLSLENIKFQMYLFKRVLGDERKAPVISPATRRLNTPPRLGRTRAQLLHDLTTENSRPSIRTPSILQRLRILFLSEKRPITSAFEQSGQEPRLRNTSTTRKTAQKPLPSSVSSAFFWAPDTMNNYNEQAMMPGLIDENNLFDFEAASAPASSSTFANDGFGPPSPFTGNIRQNAYDATAPFAPQMGMHDNMGWNAQTAHAEEAVHNMPLTTSEIQAILALRDAKRSSVQSNYGFNSMMASEPQFEMSTLAQAGATLTLINGNEISSDPPTSYDDFGTLRSDALGNGLGAVEQAQLLRNDGGSRTPVDCATNAADQLSHDPDYQNLYYCRQGYLGHSRSSTLKVCMAWMSL